MSLISSLAKIRYDSSAAFSSMGYVWFSMEAYIACIIIIVVLFNRQQNSSDQTEARIVWSRMLLTQLLYCLSKIIMTLADSNIIPSHETFNIIMISAMLLLFACVGFLMINYIRLHEQAIHGQARRFKKNRVILYSTLALLFFVCLMIIQGMNWKNPFLCYVIIITDVILYLNYSESLLPVDPLTNIPNKNGLYKTLSETLNKDSADNESLHVFVVDIDGMSVINSHYGRQEGDRALITVAEALKKFRDEEHKCYISRYYGDEFVIIALSEIQNKEDRELFIEHIRNYISNTATSKNLRYHLRVNIGFSKYEKFSKTETVTGLLEEAEKVLLEDRERRRFQNVWQK